MSLRSISSISDIPQWRRRIQPARAKSPMATADAEEQQSDTASTADTPRLRPKAKISTYFSNYLHVPASSSKSDFFSMDPWSTIEPPNSVPAFNLGQAFNHMETALIGHPNKGLPVEFNSAILHLFEAYRNLRDENREIRQNLENALQAFQASQDKWDRLEADFRDEIKRLEVIISRGKHGMTEVVLARQGSKIDRKWTRRMKPSSQAEETVWEFLSKTNPKQGTHKTMPSGEVEETVWEFLSRDNRKQEVMRRSQRGVTSSAPLDEVDETNRQLSVLIQRAPSVIQHDTLNRAWSKKLAGMRVLDDLPFGTSPPLGKDSQRLGERAKSDTTRTSEDGFSSVGDPLPDEMDDSTPRPEDSGYQQDLRTVREIASTIAQRNGFQLEKVLPPLMELFFGGGTAKITVTAHQQSSTSNQLAQSNPHQRPSRVAKASKSDDISEAKPRRRRPFSFVPGDDTQIALQQETRKASRQLKSYSSTSDIRRVSSDHTLSNSVSIGGKETRRSSKIPSPVHDPGIARSRQERGSSASSFASCVNPAKEGFERRDSSASSLRSIVTAVRHGSEQSSNRSSTHSGTNQLGMTIRPSSERNSDRSSTHSANHTPGQRLLDRKPSVRSSPVALAAARAADGASGNSFQIAIGNQQQKQPQKGVQSAENFSIRSPTLNDETTAPPNGN